MHTLQGRVAVVTGASRGLGRRVAEALAAQGASVVLLARNAHIVARVAGEIGERCLGIACDVSDPASIRAAFAEIAARFGKLDILVNNAGVSELNRIEDATEATIAMEIAVNLAGPIYCCRQAIPLMRAAGGGDILNVSSEAVHAPIPFLSIYAATKGGLEVFTQGLRGEVKHEDIRVTIVRTGHMSESGISAHWTPEARQAWLDALAATGKLAALSDDTAFPPSIVADSIVSLLHMPRSVNVDVIEIRSSGIVDGGL